VKPDNNINTLNKEREEFREPDAVHDDTPVMPEKVPHNQIPLHANPLFWLSIGCLAVAFIATAAMVVLVVMCYCKKIAQRNSNGEPLLNDRESATYSRSSSQTTDCGCADEKKNRISECESDQMPHVTNGRANNIQRLV